MDMTLPGETRVAIAGDWHGNIRWVGRAIPALRRHAPDVRTILHAGDFGIWPGSMGKSFLGAVDRRCAESGIERILVTPGNHEDWLDITARFEVEPGEPVRFSESVWVMPRGFRFELAGKTFASFGGAASIDYEWRDEGTNWWREEMPSDEDVAAIIEGGPADVLITHETINGGTAATEQVTSTNPHGWSPDALTYSWLSRRRVTRVWEALSPRVLAHGHMHVRDEIDLPDGRRVYSLGADEREGNLALLDLETLAWEWVPDVDLRPRPRRTLNLEASYLTRPEE
jgi:hypothetical protein